jgi:tetratricopeptide (TPR) repeat protein
MVHVIVGACLAWSAMGQAAGNEALLNRQPKEIEERSPGTMSDRIYKRLAKSQELMSEEKYAEAIELLDKLESVSERDPFALAQIMQTKGYTYAQQDQFEKAAAAFEKSLDQKALPMQPTLSTMYSLAQVYVAIEQYRKGIPLLQDYLFNKDPANPDAHFFYGQLLAQIDARSAAIEQVEKAISLTKSPKESWYRLLAALYYESKNYAKAAEAVEHLVRIEPDKEEYWKQLSSIYVADNQDKKALATLEVAYKKGFLREEKDMLQLVRLSLFIEVPYKAGIYLQGALKDGIVSKTRKHFELLADAWIQARELDRALEALSRAAPLAEDGSVYVRQGQIFLERERWKESVKAVEAGLAKGGLDKPGLAYVALGIARYKLGQKDESLAAFQKAKKYPRQKNQATEWINHLSAETASSS